MRGRGFCEAPMITTQEFCRVVTLERLGEGMQEVDKVCCRVVRELERQDDDR